MLEDGTHSKHQGIIGVRILCLTLPRYSFRQTEVIRLLSVTYVYTLVVVNLISLF